MFWPYAAKAKVEHEWVTDHIELYLTFNHAMLRTRDPLADPPVYDVMPPLNTWLLDCDAVEASVVVSEWFDEFTLKLTSDALVSAPSNVELEYDGPDDNLCYKWGKRFEPWGPIVSVELPQVDSTPVELRYPTHATMFHPESVVIVGAGLVSANSTLQKFDLFAFQSPGSDGDSFEQSFFLKAGSYVFSVLGLGFTNRGLVDWYIDDVMIVSGQDWYASSLSYNVIKAASDISVALNGLHTLKAVINGKNPLSSGYYLYLTNYWFRL